MPVVQIAFVLMFALEGAQVPGDPGLYYQNPEGAIRIEGRALTVEHSASKLPPLPMKGAMPTGKGTVKAQILGRHAQLHVISTPVFYFRMPPGRGGAGDLVLVKLKQKSSRREFEISGEKEWKPSSGISLKSQVEFYEKQVETGLYRLVPADDLDPGEYGFYQYRGGELPGYLYAFQVE